MKSKLKKLLDKLWRINDDFDYEILLSRSENPFESEIPDFADIEVNKAFLIDNKSGCTRSLLKSVKEK